MRALVIALVVLTAAAIGWMAGAEQIGVRQSSAPDTINLREIGFSHGRENAPVTVVEFSDFACPFCAMFARGTYPELAAELVDAGLVRWLFVPYASGQFRNGDDAERAARCAAAQSSFEPMKERLYARQREWSGERRPAGLFRDYAAEIGLEPDRFATCYDGNEVRGAMRDSKRAAEALRIRATPSFLIGDRRLEGSLPPRRFRELLLREAGAE